MNTSVYSNIAQDVTYQDRTHVDVVIPTTLERHRELALRRAIESVLSQDKVTSTVLLVANGNRQDGQLLNELANMSGVKVLRQREGSLPKALRTGRQNVTAPFFGFLDDDDELLPRALVTRMAPMLKDADTGVVVTNGFREEKGARTKLHEGMDRYQRDPLESLVDRNWLPSCGALFRTNSVEEDLWDGVTKYFEWTAIAFKIAQRGIKVQFLEDMTFVIHDSANSLSKNIEYFIAAPKVIEDLLYSETRRPIKEQFNKKVARLHHQAARMCLRQGMYKKAWWHHFMSMKSIYGALRHWKYTVLLTVSICNGRRR